MGFHASMHRGIAIAVLVGAASVFSIGCQARQENTIGVAIYKFDDTFMSGVRRSIENEATGKITLNLVDSQNQQATQNDQVDAFLTQGFKALAINPVDRTAAGIIVDKARAANVPVVFFNREPLPEDLRKWDKAYYVGAKAEQSGSMQGEIAAEYWKAHPEADLNKDGVMQYVMLKGEPGHQDAEIRTRYSIEAVSSAGVKVQMLAEDTALWDRVRGQEKMAAFLAAHPNAIEMVFANNDDMALGAIEALKAAGYFQAGKYMPVVGVDATAPALDALAAGTLLGTVLNDAAGQGKATFDLAYTLASGGPAATSVAPLVDNRYVWVPCRKVTPENYTTFKP